MGFKKGTGTLVAELLKKAGVTEISRHLAAILDASHQFMLYSPCIDLVQEIRLVEDIVALLRIVIRCNRYGSRRILGRCRPVGVDVLIKLVIASIAGAVTDHELIVECVFDKRIQRIGVDTRRAAILVTKKCRPMGIGRTT